MRLALKPHPDSPRVAAAGLDVEVTRPQAGRLLLAYVVTGRIGDLRIPAVTASVRADDLWRHTCFEAFVGAPAHAGYYEFNLAPSTHWAAYRFDGYRSGMQPADGIEAPRIDVQSSPGAFTLRAMLELSRLSDLPFDRPWRLGLSAVIEDAHGRASYWALAHPPGKADFHHTDCFTYELAAA